jgi:ribosomal protein L27
MGRDHTLFALKTGKLTFHKAGGKTIVSVEPAPIAAPVAMAAE